MHPVLNKNQYSTQLSGEKIGELRNVFLLLYPVSVTPIYKIIHRNDNRNVKKNIDFYDTRTGKIPFTCNRGVL